MAVEGWSMMNNPTRATTIGNPMRTHYPCGACRAYVARCRHVATGSKITKVAAVAADEAPNGG